MKKALFSAGLISLVAGMLILTSQPPAQARKPGKAGNSSGMASVSIQAESFAKVANAVKKVFQEDTYKLYSELNNQIIFQRAGDRRSDLAYGGLEGGVWERVILDILDEGAGKYLVECNVYMLKSPDEEIDFMDTKVLKPFARQYKKMLSRVKKLAEGS